MAAAVRARWPAATLAGVIAGLVLYAWVLHAPSDDAYIYLVYVKNALQGHGLTYNGMVVWGFTSVLWTGLLTACGAGARMLGLGSGALPALAAGASLVAACAALMTGYGAARRLGVGSGRALLVPVLLAGTGTFAFYAGSGLAMPLFSLFVLLNGVMLWSPDARAALTSWWLPCLFALTVLARPEGALIVGITGAALAWWSRSVAATLACAVRALLLLAPVQAWLRVTYGSWVPNTYWAKAGAGFANASAGLAYLTHFLQSDGIVVPLLLWVLAFRRHVIGRAALPLAAIVLSWITWVTLQGGDNMVGFRMFVPIMPLACLVLVVGLRTDRLHASTWALIGLCAWQLTVYNAGTVVGSSWARPVKTHAGTWRRDYATRKAVGLWLKRNLPADAVVAVNAAGVIPYFAERRTIDMLGLNNVHIARHGKRDRARVYGHQRGDGAYVLRQKPDVILFHSWGSKRPAPWISDREIWASPAFRDYEARQLPAGAWGYVRRRTP